MSSPQSSANVQNRSGKQPRIAVIGGGIAGVTAAWQLRRKLGPDARILLSEAYDRLGGKLKTVRFANGPVDMGAEAFLGVQQSFLDLIEAVGLTDQLRRPSAARSSFFVDGKLVDIPRETLMGIPGSGDTVKEILSDADRARLDAERDGQPMTWQRGDDATVGQLVEARLGKAVVDSVVSPLLGGVYSCSAYDLGVRSALPQLAAALDRAGEDGQGFYLLDVINELLEQRASAAAQRKKLGTTSVNGSPFVSFVGGYRSLIEEMMKQARPELILNTPVEEIGRTGDGRWSIDPLGLVDAVIVATPAPTASVLLQDVAPMASELLDTVELSSSAVVGMRFASDHGLPERSGVLLGADAPTEAKAFTFSSRKWPHLGDRGGAFVRASYGTKAEPWYVEATDRALISYAMDDLYRVTGESKTPQEFFVQRWYGGLPCYGIQHLDRMAEVQRNIAGIPGLALAGAMLNGVGVPATAETGTEAADKISGEFS